MTVIKLTKEQLYTLNQVLKDVMQKSDDNTQKSLKPIQKKVFKGLTK